MDHAPSVPGHILVIFLSEKIRKGTGLLHLHRICIIVREHRGQHIKYKNCKKGKNKDQEKQLFFPILPAVLFPFSGQDHI